MIWLIAEVALLALALALSWWGSGVALDEALLQAQLRSGELIRSPEEARAALMQARLAFTGGLLALGAARLWSARRGQRNLPAPLLLPAVAAAAGLGFVLQTGYGDPLHAVGWPGADFGIGVGIGGVLAAILLAMPGDPARWIDRLRYPLIALVLGGFVVLAAIGTGPAGTDTHINLALGPVTVQPIEALKLAFVCLLGVTLGRQAIKLRYQRQRAGLLRIPRPKLLIGSIAFLLSLFAGLVFVNDLGPTLILSLVFLGLFYVVTRSPGWVFAAVGSVALAVIFLAINPEAAGSGTVQTRLEMWLNPWLNGLSNGIQLAQSRWAIAAGGLDGQGLGQAQIGALAEGHTDLILAHLAEELGVFGGWLYLTCLGALVLQGLLVAAGNRTPERAMLAAGCALLILAQWAVIFSGTVGLLPLTGVVAPFLSFGKSSMIAFVLTAALLMKLAEGGRPRHQTDELRELRGGMLRLTAASAGGLVMAGFALFFVGVVRGPATSARACLTTLGDGTVKSVYDPRVQALANQVRRGEILDRNGEVLAGTDESGARTYPLGTSIGTLLGPPRSDVILRRGWMLERTYEETLRGFPDRAQNPGVWLAEREGGGDEFLFAVKRGEERDADRERAERMAPGRDVRFRLEPAPDYRSIIGLMHLDGAAKERALAEVVDDVESRSVQLTLDARLQEAAAAALAKHMGNGEAAAAVVIDVDTGEVLARAQVPDLDLADPDWYKPLVSGDREATGIYGPLADKTGLVGFYQAGSISKVYTALAAVNAGISTSGQGCNISVEEEFACKLRDSKGPYFTQDGWRKPIHDYYKDRNHGDIDLVDALSVSCNVYFGQLGLMLGPEPFADLSAKGMQIGWSSEYDAGPAGTRQLASTAFGQGAAAMNASQAARMVATVGSGGTYRMCPTSLELGAACESTQIIDDTDGLTAVLAGMRKAVDAGTARRLTKLDGVRVYGKTGTADSIGLRDEEPYGFVHGEIGYRPHSWFVALAEPGDADGCGPYTSGRLAVAVVVPRAGAGAAFAGPAALEIIGAANGLGYFGGGEDAADGEQDPS